MLADAEDAASVQPLKDYLTARLNEENGELSEALAGYDRLTSGVEDSLNRIMPLEVKSADNTRAKSLATYCRQYKPELAFKVSAKNIGDNQKGDTHEISLPLYLLWRLPVYIGQ